MVSERSAEEVVASHTITESSIKQESTQPTFQGNMVHRPHAHGVCCFSCSGEQGVAVFDVGPGLEEGEVFTYQPPSQDLEGPGVPDVEELGSYG